MGRISTHLKAGQLLAAHPPVRVGSMGWTGAKGSVPCESLVDARFDSDSCGVGFVATTTRVPSHQILSDALIALSRLAHRGATAADGKSSDGVGIMAAVPRELLLDATGVKLAEEKLLGVGMMFLPEGETRAEAVMTECLLAAELEVLAWRDVPTRVEVLGEIALRAMPRIRQVLVADRLASIADSESTMERRL
jgi:glutamate synthase (ferredoxin)